MAPIRPLELKDRTLVTGYLRRHPPEVSELTFTNLFVWRKSRPVSFVEVDGSLVFVVEAQEDDVARKLIFGPPVGDIPAADTLASLDPEVEGFVRIPRETGDALQGTGLKVEPDRDNWDYVHRVEDLAQLAGRRFHKKRNLVKQCLEAHECRYEVITRQNLEECLDMQERWCKARQCGREPGLCAEYIAIREALANYRELQLIGGGVRVNGKIEAYALGEELNPGTAVCHFEKAMPGTQGLSQVINQWFARYSLSQFDFVNREQDLGIPGLRQAKESYYPHHMVEKFTALREPRDLAVTLAIEPHECEKHIRNWD